MPANGAFQDAILFMGMLGLIGGAVALLIHDRDAAATMTARTAIVEDGVQAPSA